MELSRSAMRIPTLAMACALLLCACESVEFQSPPSLPLAPCDAELVGDWRVHDLSESASENGDQYLRITAGCEHWFSIDVETDEGGQAKIDIDDLEDDMALGISRAGHQAYIAAREHPKAPEDGVAASEPSGYILVGYEHVHHDVILRQIDMKTTAHLIVDGAIPGWIDKHDRNVDGSRRAYGQEFSVFVFGSSDETRGVLEQHQLLSDPWMRLSPVDAATSARLDQWMAELKTPVEQQN